ncbi:MAG: hypothetical protein EU548_09955 [Promethearchaeota archaeon]|nr:MAG: hypothetical protein EU548_09955 [Candidatus Lokiarchaeota archaeon]
MNENNFPILVGVSQYIQRKEATTRLDPLTLMIKTGRNAIESTHRPKIKDFIDAIFMVNINSWSYEDAPALLAKHLHITPKEKVYLSDGGNTPQMLINRAAKDIYEHKLRAVLVIGAEAAYSRLLARKGVVELDWPKREPPAYMEGEIWDGVNDFENKYKFKFPTHTYALFETAVRAASNRSIEGHRIYVGELFQHFSEIAAKNPYAWSQKSYNAEEITTPTLENRKICYPYTKRMCSNMFVDQSAAILMTSESLAKNIEISKENWVYLMGCADLKNVHEITQRPELYASPACRVGAQIALKQAGLDLKDISAFDLYSCFPSIVEIMMNEIGIPESYSRDLTITGGLPYFGGPWSNYSLHAIASTVERIHEKPQSKIMVVANGGYNSKQSFGIYGAQPPSIIFSEINSSEVQNKILNDKLKPPVIKASGTFTIEAYTVIYNRDQMPIEAIVIGKVNPNQRSLAFIRDTPKKLAEILKENLVEKTVKVNYKRNLQCNIIDFD